MKIGDIEGNQLQSWKSTPLQCFGSHEELLGKTLNCAVLQLGVSDSDICNLKLCSKRLRLPDTQGHQCHPRGSSVKHIGIRVDSKGTSFKNIYTVILIDI